MIISISEKLRTSHYVAHRTGITNNITETNNQTIAYVGNNYLNNNKIATVILNTVPSLTDN